MAGQRNVNELEILLQDAVRRAEGAEKEREEEERETAQDREEA